MKNGITSYKIVGPATGESNFQASPRPNLGFSHWFSFFGRSLDLNFDHIAHYGLPGWLRSDNMTDADRVLARFQTRSVCYPRYPRPRGSRVPRTYFPKSNIVLAPAGQSRRESTVACPIEPGARRTRCFAAPWSNVMCRFLFPLVADMESQNGKPIDLAPHNFDPRANRHWSPSTSSAQVAPRRASQSVFSVLARIPCRSPNRLVDGRQSAGRPRLFMGILWRQPGVSPTRELSPR